MKQKRKLPYTVWIASENNKGGSGKTEQARELGGAYGELGYATLVVDCDSAGHLTRGLNTGLPPGEEIYLADTEINFLNALVEEKLPRRVLETHGPIRPEDIIISLPDEKFDLLPAHEDMVHYLHERLMAAHNREQRLWQLLTKIQGYDVIILDAPPEAGPMNHNINFAIRDADINSPHTVTAGRSGLVVPMEADDANINALDQLLSQISALQKVFKIHIPILLIVLNRYEEINFSKKIESKLTRIVPANVISPIKIRRRNVVRDVYASRKTVFSFWPSEPHLRQNILDLRTWYLDLARLILQRMDESGNPQKQEKEG